MFIKYLKKRIFLKANEKIIFNKNRDRKNEDADERDSQFEKKVIQINLIICFFVFLILMNEQQYLLKITFF